MSKYIITVHGIGEQQLNSTLVPVVSRIAEAQRNIDHAERNVVTLGSATGQTGYYEDGNLPDIIWTEYESVRTDVSGTLPPFYGEMAHHFPDPDNLRFVDIYWQDILRKHYDRIGQKPEEWTEAVVGRSERRISNLITNNKGVNTEAKILSALYSLEDTLGMLSKIMRLRSKALYDLAFGKFLGDVQVYTESLECRREAIQRFHAVMDKLHAKHAELHSGNEPEYYIIAHSLGSVMSYDALIAAAAKNDLPMTLSLNADKAAKNTVETKPWFKNIKGYVTLGSPLDKIHTLWWLNYQFLESPQDWLAEEYLQQPDDKRIPHFNYCDEQDPVGNELTLINHNDTYEKLFELKDNYAFNRYIAPGAAHIQYWKDSGLFKFINERIINRNESEKRTSKFWYNKKIYLCVLAITYLLIPLVVAGADMMMLAKALTAHSFQGALFYSFLFVCVTVLGRNLLMLAVAWRMSSKRISIKTNENVPRFTFALIVTFLLSVIGSALYLIVFFPFGEGSVVFPLTSFTITLLTVGAGGLGLKLILKQWKRPDNKQHTIQTSNFTIDLIVFLAAAAVIGLSYAAGYLEIPNDIEAFFSPFYDRTPININFAMYTHIGALMLFVVMLFTFMLYIKGKLSISEIPYKKAIGIPKTK